jgi:phosphoglycolate phosphatase
LEKRVREYLDFYDLIYAGETKLDFGSMPLYQKLPVPVGFVPSTEVFPEKTPVTVRTLEGDVDMLTDSKVYLMIGIQGEVYPISSETFVASYDSSEEPYSREWEYQPVLLNRITGEKHEILHMAKKCVPKESKLVRGQILKRDAKVFTRWDTEKYYRGCPDDFIVANEGRYDDCYIVQKNIFAMTYKSVETS